MTACLSRLADVFFNRQSHTYGCKLCFSSHQLYSYEANFTQGLLKKNKKKPARSFKLTFRCIDYVFLLHNSRLGAFVDRIYPIGFEIKDTTDTVRFVSYLDLHSEINSEGRLRMKNCDNKYAFNFPIVNFPCIYTNIPAAPTYGVHSSQFIRYSRTCVSSLNFFDIDLLLKRKLHKGSYWLIWGHHLTWLSVAEYLCHKWQRICSTCHKHFPFLIHVLSPGLYLE